eukprot:5634257-Pyramimonas_sp.AAC.1
MPIAAKLYVDGHAAARVELLRDHPHAHDEIRRPETAVDHHSAKFVGQLGEPENHGGRPRPLAAGHALWNWRPGGCVGPLLVIAQLLAARPSPYAAVGPAPRL